MAEAQKVEIGFEGGQVVAVRLSDGELKSLRKQLDKGGLVTNAELAGSVQLWEWIGDDGATTFSY